jgi:hypothetical protein
MSSHSLARSCIEDATYTPITMQLKKELTCLSHKLIHCPPNSMELTSKIEMSHITMIPPYLPIDSRKAHLTVTLFHKFLMKESQQLSFFVSNRKQISTLLLNNLFWMEYRLLDIRNQQLFKAKIFIDRAKTKPDQNLTEKRPYS